MLARGGVGMRRISCRAACKRTRAVCVIGFFMLELHA